MLDQNTVWTSGITETDLYGHSFLFQVLGTFSIASPTLRIVLTTGSDGVTFAGTMLIQLQTASAYTEAVSSKVTAFSNGPPTMSVNGGSPVALSNVIWGKTTLTDPLPHMVFLLSPSQYVLPTDTVTLTLSNYIVTTAAGIVPGVTNQQVVNKVGGTFVTMPTGAQPLEIGWNVNPNTNDGSAIAIHANQAKRISSLNYQGSDNPPPALNSDGYPQFLHGDSYYFSFGNLASNPVDPKGYPILPTGLVTFMWDAPAALGDILVRPNGKYHERHRSE